MDSPTLAEAMDGRALRNTNDWLSDDRHKAFSASIY